MHFSAELDLLIQCARLEADAACRERIGSLLNHQLDWDRLFKLADFHRLAPLLDLHLKPFANVLSNETKAVLRSKTLAILATNMRIAGEFKQLQRRLSEEQIPALFMKGPVTAWDLYGDLRLRSFFDLDLLIARRDLDKTLNLLLGLGYTPEFPLKPWPSKIYCDQFTEMCLWRGEPALVLDVHWELFESGFSFSLDTDKVWHSRKRISSEAAGEFFTLSEDDWLFFACMHVSKHAWSRISWLVDIAEYVKKHARTDFDYLFGRPEARSSQVRLLTAFALISRVLAAEIPREITRRIESNAKVSKLIHGVMTRWELPATHRPMPHRDPHFLALESWSDRTTYFYKHFLRPSPIELGLVPLPRFLRAGYYLIRPARLLYRRLTGTDALARNPKLA